MAAFLSLKVVCTESKSSKRAKKQAALQIIQMREGKVVLNGIVASLLPQVLTEEKFDVFDAHCGRVVEQEGVWSRE